MNDQNLVARRMAADEPVVRELVERFRAFYETLINERADSKESTRFLDFLMAVHNFHVLAILDVMEREEDLRHPADKIGYLNIWGRTFEGRIKREITKVIDAASGREEG